MSNVKCQMSATYYGIRQIFTGEFDTSTIFFFSFWRWYPGTVTHVFGYLVGDRRLTHMYISGQLFRKESRSFDTKSDHIISDQIKLKSSNRFIIALVRAMIVSFADRMAITCLKIRPSTRETDAQGSGVSWSLFSCQHISQATGVLHIDRSLSDELSEETRFLLTALPTSF